MASLLGGLGGGREYVLKIVADVTDAVKGVDDVATKTTSMKDKMIGIGKGVAAGLATAAVVKFGESAINAAADADDAADMIDSAFGGASKTISDFAKTAADKMGMSTTAYENMAGKTGQILTGFGIAQEDAAKQTNTLTQRAADMAAIWGTDVPTAMDAIDKAMQGQTKGMKQFGVSLDKSEIDAKALAMGYKDASGKVTAAGRAIATQQLILEKTGKYQGEFAKNSKDLGSQQDILKAKFENIQTSIGNALLPVIVKLFDVIQPLITFISQNTDWLVPLAAGIMGVVVAVKAWNIAQLILNSTLLANPIFLIVAAVAALTAAIIWAYNNVGWFRDAVDAAADAIVAAFVWVKDTVVSVFNWVKDNWPLLLGILTGPIGLAVVEIIKHWDAIKNGFNTAFNAIKDFLGNFPGWLQNAWKTVGDILTYPFRKAWEYIEKVGGWIKSTFTGVVDKITQVFAGVENAIKLPFKWAFDAIKWFWNNTIGGLKVNIPGWGPVPGWHFTVPEMALGGIVTRPTLAMIGEAGPEAVIPLDRLTTAPPETGDTYIVNVYALTPTAETGRIVAESLREYQRRNGAIA